ASKQKIRIDRPLDFLVVADHSEMLQLEVRLDKEDPVFLATASGKRLAAAQKTNPRAAFAEVGQIGRGGGEEVLRDFNTVEIRRRTWGDQVDIAERHNHPGKFTAMIGWEWSPAPNWANLHRVIFTPANAETAKKFVPLGYYDTEKPEELWAWLDKTSKETGADFVAIPHNSNMSDGKMFDVVDSDGRPFTAAYARTRMRWEPVMEITQIKGTSEVHPQFSPEDPFAGFEIRNKLLTGADAKVSPNSYARSALLQGMQMEANIGANPYKFGFVGGTDSHTGLTSVREDDFLGKLVSDSLPASRVAMQGNFAAWDTSAGGLAGVWATENTREAIAEAFKRKEVYGTSGPRIALRFFGGFDFEAADALLTDAAETGYKKGVPMGGDLSTAPPGKVPTFLVQVSKDPLSGNLDRVEIIKGWLDAKGKTHEKVYDVAWAGERKPDAKGFVPALPSTVNIETASYDNTQGAVQLNAMWRDPSFDPKQRAFYYVRALEIETPRHQVYDAVALKIDPKKSGKPLTIQERAWSSPIWYTP
ncbi:MAG TPA: DUF3604 domain-containing protein, partial [Candidatus Acidoferrum sp.]|nr:DUF3604 domain-containing protein [Candidatus Acidoferrum sp.]